MGYLGYKPADKPLTSADITDGIIVNADISSTAGITLNKIFGNPNFRNRIINGDMQIDQRNSGASVTPTNLQYTLDRWLYQSAQASKISIQQNAGSVTLPVGFINYLGSTSLSAYTVGSSEFFMFSQRIEGFNISDLNWGTANAKTVTLSFRVQSSLTGTFGGVIGNHNSTRAYPFSYTISSANTWTTISVTIAGDTSGTWLTTNGLGIVVYFSLGTGATLSGTAGSWTSSECYSVTGATSVVGTSGATFYITGVQLEAGTSATDFEFLPIDVDLQRCQRYYYKLNAVTSSSFFADGQCSQTTEAKGTIFFKTEMRTNPTALEQSGTAAHYRVNHSNSSTTCNSVPTFGVGSSSTGTVNFTVASGLTQGRAGSLQSNSTSAYLAWSAEL
jgi:hypothetical protein